MAYEKVKTEGKGRWCRRAIAKVAAKKRRRAADKKAVKAD